MPLRRFRHKTFSTKFSLTCTFILSRVYYPRAHVRISANRRFAYGFAPHRNMRPSDLVENGICKKQKNHVLWKNDSFSPRSLSARKARHVKCVRSANRFPVVHAHRRNDLCETYTSVSVSFAKHYSFSTSTGISTLQIILERNIYPCVHNTILIVR